MPHFTATTLILIAIVALLLFGPNKLPELGRAFGKTLREFKSGTKDLLSSDDDDVKATPPQGRKEIQAEEVRVHELKVGQPTHVATEKQDTPKPQDNRRLPD